ncbi:alpha-amylase/4-alpha-glucanotransferase domain-containing protein [Nitrosomonas sp. Nm166]|uniref:alpha-amylase/4-alpha-glucanotransferase domain-containing protein n=1 Tax=Nitrosomonas sp. Nm166 TaxID=1881054 RepID=UPI0008E12E88|nr:alpha-amylase/4-alpha-glucanotransferase domain-containing protein [Nitrosomonas sp. Nm166]SFE80491.1 4-alpha-glucanotransferase/alpha-amylase [Nitrosomonas sp. Nm166]
MSKRVSLLFGVHAHQPVGNFPHVLTDAHLRCYQPFLQVLYRYPDFRFAVHFSGWLLDYLMQHFPEDMALLHEMVMRKQVELFGAGDTEPVLAAIPNRDRIGQIETFSSKLAARLGQRPQGAWLTERVWESTVVPALADCGIRYVIVDDYHFLCAGKTYAELNGYFTTEEDTRKLDLFPISESLRYKIPFYPVEETIAYLESLADHSLNNSVAAIYFDDIEKFGIWPETYQWVYEKGWLERFIQSVLGSTKICTQHYNEYHACEKTRGVIYLPTVSYIEMNEWTLPAQSANSYADLVRQAKTDGWYEPKKAFLRGGIWKNFFSCYPESNWMHKRMLGLSARLNSLSEKQRTELMQQKLYESQANDAYWHGLFGGLYLPHLRRAVYNGLVELEALLDACMPRPALFTEDTDLDGVTETYLQNGILQAVVKLDSFASICELDAYRLKHNFGDTLRSQVEYYHQKIQPGEHSSSNHAVNGIASAHDRISYKHEITAVDMVADDHPRSLFVDCLDDMYIAYQSASVPEHSRFESENTEHPIHKHIMLNNNQLQVTYHFGAKMAQVMFSTEINLAMPSCDGAGGRYIYQGEIPGGFGQLVDLADLTEITLEDDTLDGNVVLKASSPVTFVAHPHFSVSQSESGFEKIMQAVILLLKWPITTPELVITLEINPRIHQ